MESFTRSFSSLPGAMEVAQEPLPPVPPELELDLDLNVDFDRLPEIEIPADDPVPPAPAPKEEPAPSARVEQSASSTPREARAPRRPFAWWSALAGAISLLSVALLAVPFALARLSEMSREVTRLSERIDQKDAENQTLHARLAHEAMDAVAQHLADTDRRIERMRGALDEVGHDCDSHAVAPAAQKTPPQPAAPVQSAAAAPPASPAAVAPKEQGPIVGASKTEEPIRPAAAVKGPAPSHVEGQKPAAKPKEAKGEKQGGSGIVLPTELYNEDD